jgi:dTDP-4-amino-4,6-dideoxygalactose transaminase
MAERLRALRSHGITREPDLMEQPAEGAWVYEQQSLGYNARMTEMQAALGLSQLRRLPSMQVRREALARRYDVELSELPLRLPTRLPDRIPSWHLYAVEIDPARTPIGRNTVFAGLRALGIGVNVHYIPIHTQPYYRRLGFKPGDFPNAERYYAHALSLPLFPDMTDAQQDMVIVAVHRLMA